MARVVYDDNNTAVDYRLLKVNAAYSHITGFEAANVEGRLGSEVYGQFPPPYFDTYREVAIHGHSQYFETDYSPLQKSFSISVFSPETGQFATVFSDISERKKLYFERDQLLAKLDSDKAFFKTLLENLPDMIWLKDADGVYLSCNHEFELFFGATKAEILGKTDDDFVEPELADFFRQHDRNAMQKDHPVINEEWIRYNSDGRRVLLETTKTAIRNSNGELIGVLGIGHDITQRKQHQVDLQQQQELLEEAQQLAAIGNWELDVASGSLHWSNQVYRLFDQAPEHYQPRHDSIAELIHADDREQAKATFREAIEQHKAYSMTYRTEVNGQVKYIEEKARADYDQNDAHPLRVYGTVQDVTERVLYQTQANRFNQLIEQSTDGIYLIEAASGAILNLNEAACSSLGYTRAELIKKPIWSISQNITSLQAWQQALPNFIDISGTVFEDTHQTRDGRLLPVEVNARYIVEQQDQFFLAIARDISERKRHEQLLQEHSQRFQSVINSSKDGFWLVNEAGNILEVNQTYCDYSGYSSSEIVQLGIHDLDAHDDHASVMAGLQKVKHEGGAIFETTHKRKDGQPWPVEVSITYTEIQSGRYIVFLRNIEDRKRAEEKIEFMAFNDMLTGLPNRRLFADRLQQTIQLSNRNQQLLALCYIDLDGFKPVNDQYGHAIGDRLLVQLAQRLSASLREMDTLARLGGDEFVLLLGGLEKPHQAEEIVSRVLELIAQPFTLETHQLQVSASIGVTLYPHDCADPDTLLRHADQAMYLAKEMGKNRYWLFDTAQQEQRESERQQLSRFEHALARNQLVLYFQPRLHLPNGSITAVEALIRWPDPEYGMLLPGQFLPLIANTAAELALDQWVLRQALDQHMRWRESGLKIAVSVNISPRHIQQEDFATQLERLLHHYPDDIADYLELEILETSAIGNITQVADNMQACHALGIGFSLDDFGTGYSSLTYFHQLPIQILKLDQAFVRNMLNNHQDQDIVEGVLKLAQALKRPVVAEGVENSLLGLMLLQMGCENAQGYGIARPMPAEKLEAWLESFSNDPQWQTVGHCAQHSADPDRNLAAHAIRYRLRNLHSLGESENPQQQTSTRPYQNLFWDWLNNQIESSALPQQLLLNIREMGLQFDTHCAQFLNAKLGQDERQQAWQNCQNLEQQLHAQILALPDA